MKENKLAKTSLTFVFLAFLSFHFFILQILLDVFVSSIARGGGDLILIVVYLIAIPIFFLSIYRFYYVLRWMEERYAVGLSPFIKTFFAFAIPISIYLIYKDEFKIETTGLVIFISLAVRWGMEQVFLKHTKKQNK